MLKTQSLKKTQIASFCKYPVLEVGGASSSCLLVGNDQSEQFFSFFSDPPFLFEQLTGEDSPIKMENPCNCTQFHICIKLFLWPRSNTCAAFRKAGSYWFMKISMDSTSSETQHNRLYFPLQSPTLFSSCLQRLVYRRKAAVHIYGYTAHSGTRPILPQLLTLPRALVLDFRINKFSCPRKLKTTFVWSQSNPQKHWFSHVFMELYQWRAHGLCGWCHP